MFGFEKKKSEGFKELPEVRDLMKEQVGEAVNVYVLTTVGYLTKQGTVTAVDVNKTMTQMLSYLQRYVQAEILLDRQKHGHEPSLAEIAYLRLK